MELLIEEIKNVWPSIYIFGLIGVWFYTFCNIGKDLKDPDVAQVIALFLYSGICGGIWPGLIIAKLVA